MKKYQFNVFDLDLQFFLESDGNVSEKIRNILDDVRKGILVRKEDIDYDEQMKDEKLKKIRKENIQLDINNRIKLIHELKISPDTALLIAKGEKILDSIDGLACPENPKCHWHTSSSDSMNYQINQLTSHMKTIHKRDLTEEEAETFSRLLI